MKRVLAVGLVALLSSPAAAAPPIDPALAASAFDEARALSDADGGKLWGRRLYGPMLFVDRETRAVVANEPDREGHLHKEGAIFTGTLPDSVLVANTATRWAG